jgi:hypothetical protein
VTGPQQYQVQFTTVEEHAHLVERAKALLARSRPGMTLGELHLEAMKLLVASLEKRKFAITDQPRPRAAPRQRGETEGQKRETAAAPRQRGKNERETAAPGQRGETATAPRKRSRYIPAAERREVYRRDAGRCTYVDARDERCCETHYLELHHLRAFAKGGAHIASNLTLRCAAHNALAAEEDFGPRLMAERRESTRHEPFTAQPQ